MAAYSLLGLASKRPPTLEIGEEIRTGSYRVLYEGELDGKPVAIRKVDLLQLRMDFASVIVEEALLMKQLSHPHIVKVLEVYESKEEGPVVVMEKMHGNLRRYLKHHAGKLSRKRQVAISLQIADAIHYLHSQQPPVVRRNLNDHYILLSRDGTAKLGRCTYVARIPPAGFFVESLSDLGPYVPPEALLENAHYNEKVDIFSLGVVMLEVATQRYPMVSQSELIEVDTIPEVDHHAEHLSLLPEDHPLKPIILQCLRDDPRERPDSGAVLRMLSGGETTSRHSVCGQVLHSAPILSVSLLLCILKEIGLDRLACNTEKCESTGQIAFAGVCGSTLMLDTGTL